MICFYSYIRAHFVLLCICFLQLFVQQGGVHAMFHQKLSVQVEDWNVQTIPVQPDSVLWKTNVHLLQDQLKKNNNKHEKSINGKRKFNIKKLISKPT